MAAMVIGDIFILMPRYTKRYLLLFMRSVPRDHTHTLLSELRSTGRKYKKGTERNMLKDIFKLVRDEESNEFRIYAEFEEKSLKLILLQNCNAWTVDVQHDKVISLAKKLELDHMEYYSKIKKILCDKPETVDFKITDTEFTIYCNLESKIRIKYFSCPIKKVVYSECIEKLLDRFYIERTKLSVDLESTLKVKDDLKESTKKIEVALQEFIERKNNDDEELYSSFVLVLNEKKRKIQHLNQLLEAFKGGRPILNQPVELKRKNKNKSQVKEVQLKEEVSDSDINSDSGNYQTDEEKSSDQNYDTNIFPSTSIQENNFLLEESPPRDNLPKRMKVEETTETETHISSVSKIKTEDLKLEVTNDTKGNSQDVSFSTQELLDHI